MRFPRRVAKLGLLGRDHFVGNPRYSAYAFSKREQRFPLFLRVDEPPEMHDTVADRDVPAAEIGPRLILQARQQLKRSQWRCFSVPISTRWIRSALAEHADKIALRLNNRQRADVVLREELDRFADIRTGTHGYDIAHHDIDRALVPPPQPVSEHV
jgi:hypothetical protein